MKSILTAITLAVAVVSSASAASFKPLVDATELSSRLAAVNPTLLDIRGEAYANGHIPGAISAPYGLFRGPKSNPGGLVDVETLETSFERLGLSQNDPIVIISNGDTSTDFGASARVYWTLKSTGFSDLTILNGGYAAWTNAGLATETITNTPTPSELDLTFDPTWHAGTQDVNEVINGNTSAKLVDARLKAFYDGEKSHPAAKSAGTLPGAVNHSFTNFFEKDSAAINANVSTAALSSTLGVQDGEAVISFCNTGHWAATHWFAVSELGGVKNAKLYAGSMVEYSNADLPMENAPGFFSNLLRQIGL